MAALLAVFRRDLYLALRQGGDLRLVHRVNGRSQIGDNLVAGDVQFADHRGRRKLDDIRGVADRIRRAASIGTGRRNWWIIGLGDGGASTRRRDQENDGAINPVIPGVASTFGRARSSRTKVSFHTIIDIIYVSNPEFLLTRACWLL